MIDFCTQPNFRTHTRTLNLKPDCVKVQAKSRAGMLAVLVGLPSFCSEAKPPAHEHTNVHAEALSELSALEGACL